GRSFGRRSRSVCRPLLWHPSRGDRTRQNPAPVDSGQCQGCRTGAPGLTSCQSPARLADGRGGWRRVVLPCARYAAPGPAAADRSGQSEPEPLRDFSAPPDREHVQRPPCDSLCRQSFSRFRAGYTACAYSGRGRAVPPVCASDAAAAAVKRGWRASPPERPKYLNINFSILMWPEILLYNLCRNGSGCLPLLGLNMKKTYMQKMVTNDIL